MHEDAVEKLRFILIKTSGNHRLESAGLDAVKGRYWGGIFFFFFWRNHLSSRQFFQQVAQIPQTVLINYRIYSNKRRPQLTAAHGVDKLISAALE